MESLNHHRPSHQMLLNMFRARRIVSIFCSGVCDIFFDRCVSSATVLQSVAFRSIARSGHGAQIFYSLRHCDNICISS